MSAGHPNYRACITFAEELPPVPNTLVVRWRTPEMKFEAATVVEGDWPAPGATG